MRIGIISSSNGGAFKAAWRILQHTSPTVAFYVITDRECGIEAFCAENKIPHVRINEPDNAAFSAKAKIQFDAWGGVQAVLLFYFRLVTSELFDHYTTLNLHESLLPAYRGFQAIKRAFEAGEKEIGTTLHLVDAGADTGATIAQARYELAPDDELDDLNRVSFLHKAYLTLLAVDMLQNGVQFDAEGVTDAGTFSVRNQRFFTPCIQNRDYLVAIRAVARAQQIPVNVIA